MVFSCWSLFNRRFSKLHEPNGTDVGSGSLVKAIENGNYHRVRITSFVLFIRSFSPFGSVMKRKEESLACDIE